MRPGTLSLYKGLVIWYDRQRFTKCFTQWRSDGGAGRTGRHLLGAAKGRKTPTKSTAFLHDRQQIFVGRFYWQKKIGQLRRLSDIPFRFVQLEADSRIMWPHWVDVFVCFML